MKEGWRYIDFKDVYPIKMGKTPPRGDKSSWDINKITQNKWVSIADISNNEGKIITDTKEYISDSAAKKIYKASKGNLLMSFKLSIGRMAFAGVDLYTNEAIIAIPENEKYNIRFIYYYLLSYDWLSLTEGNEKVKGATLNKSSIGRIKIPVLPLSEQQSIVSYLDSSFAKIDAMKVNAEKALEEAKALFQATLKEMLEPKEGWEERLMKDICSIDSKLVNPQENKYKQLLHVGGANIVPISGEFIDLKTACEENLISNKFYFEDNVVLYNKIRPYLVKVAKPYFSGLCSADMYPLTPKDVVTKEFLYYILTSKEFTEYAILGSARAGMPKVNRECLFAYRCSVPPLSEQQSIVTTLDTLKSKVDSLQANYDKISQECDALKQAILRQVFE